MHEDSLLALAQLPAVHCLKVRGGCDLSVAVATQLVNTSRLKHLLLCVAGNGLGDLDDLDDLDDAMEVLRAAPGLQFRQLFC
jgi:hypothetical protein